MTESADLVLWLGDPALAPPHAIRVHAKADLGPPPATADVDASRATRRAVRDMADLTMPAAGHTALQAVRAASEEDAPPDWEALTDAVNTLGRVLWR